MPSENRRLHKSDSAAAMFSAVEKLRQALRKIAGRLSFPTLVRNAAATLADRFVRVRLEGNAFRRLARYAKRKASREDRLRAAKRHHFISLLRGSFRYLSHEEQSPIR